MSSSESQGSLRWYLLDESCSSINNITPYTMLFLLATHTNFALFLKHGKMSESISNDSSMAKGRTALDQKSLALFDYSQIIQKPMELRHIKRNIDQRSYSSTNDAADDLRLIWKNCMQFKTGEVIFIYWREISQNPLKRVMQSL